MQMPFVTTFRRSFRVIALMAFALSMLLADPAQAQNQTRRSAHWAASRVDADARPVRDVLPAKPKTTGVVRQVGHMQAYGEEIVYGDAMPFEPGCGIESGCGFETSCGCESACGCEPACGMEPTCGCDVCGGGCDGAACCDDACCATGDCFPLCLPILRIDWNRFAFFAGTTSFKSPLNYAQASAAGQPRVGSGSFGYQEGFNEGRSLRNILGGDLAAQFGVRATQANLHGEEFTPESRNQIFVTGGLFRRVDFGFQYGVVVDYLNDDWFYQTDLIQIRGELSWKTETCHEFGFQFMSALNDDVITTRVTDLAGASFTGTDTIQAATQYRGFYRRLLGATGSWTSFIGGTDEEHLILGSTVDVPLNANLSIQAGSTYFLPGDDSVLDKVEAEGWSMGLALVYRPGGHHARNRYRQPMFEVADNGTFFVTRK